MDLLFCMFYAGGIIHLRGRGRGWLQCIFWPVEAGKALCRWLDRIENERAGGPQ